MLPLNYAVLKYFTSVDEASVDCVMDALKDQYSTFRAFKKHDVLTALFVAKANFILEESRYELDENDYLRLYFKITDEGRKMITTYVG